MDTGDIGKTRYHIRPATPNDLDEIVRLCAEHAEFERAEYAPDGIPIAGT